MDSIVQAILNHSKLEVSLIRISKATKDTFVMQIESRTTNTGPLPATMAPMTVELVGPTGAFGTLNLPEVKTSSKGADVNIPDQEIKISNESNFVAFLKALQKESKLTMHLDNGKGTIKAMMVKANIVYKKPIEMKGMDGPSVEVAKTEDHGDGKFTNTMIIENPSPVEIDLGSPTFAWKNEAGEVIATQSAPLKIARGQNKYLAQGQVVKKGAASAKLRLVGVTEGVDTWIKHTLENFDSFIRPSEEFKAVLA